MRFREIWAQGPGRPWTPTEPPEAWDAAVAAPGWLADAEAAVGRLANCRWFVTPVTLVQFLGQGFVGRVLGGQYDSPREEPARKVRKNHTIGGG